MSALFTQIPRLNAPGYLPFAIVQLNALSPSEETPERSVFKEEAPVPVFKDSVENDAPLPETESESEVRAAAEPSTVMDEAITSQPRPERARPGRGAKRPGQDELPL